MKNFRKIICGKVKIPLISLFSLVVFVFFPQIARAADPDAAPVIAGANAANGAAQGAKGKCEGLQPPEKDKCDSCADDLKGKGEKTKAAADKMGADFNAANASSINTAGGDTQAGGAGGAGQTACDGADAAGDKLDSSGLKDMLKDECKAPEGCKETPAESDAKDYEDKCKKAKEDAKKAQTKQQKVQSKAQSMCKQDKEDEKKEGPPKKDEDKKPPEVPPFKPPEKEKKEDQKPPEPPKLAAPVSGITIAEKGRGDPVFEKKEELKEAKEKDARGPVLSGLSKNESDTTKSNFIPGVFVPAVSKVDGGGGGSGSSGSGSSREGSGAGNDKSKTKDTEAISSIDIGGGHLFKGGKGSVYGVATKGDEFDDLKRDLEESPKKINQAGSSGEGSNTSTSAKSPVADTQGSLFQIIHNEYMHLWKAGKL